MAPLLALEALRNAPHGVVAIAILIGGFSAVLWRRWRRDFRAAGGTGGVAAAERAIADTDSERSVPNASRMLDALRTARLAPASEAQLQPELGRLERALERSASSWDIPRFDSGAEASEFGSALSAFIAKLRVTPLRWLEDPRNRHARP